MSSASVVLVVEVENVLVGDDMELGVIDLVLTCTVDLLGYCLPSTLLRVGDIVAIILQSFFRTRYKWFRLHSKIVIWEDEVDVDVDVGREARRDEQSLL